MMSCLRRIGYKVPRDLSLVIPGPNIGCAASNESVMTPIGLMNPIAPSLPNPASRFLANTHTNTNLFIYYAVAYTSLDLSWTLRKLQRAHQLTIGRRFMIVECQ